MYYPPSDPDPLSVIAWLRLKTLVFIDCRRHLYLAMRYVAFTTPLVITHATGILRLASFLHCVQLVRRPWPCTNGERGQAPPEKAFVPSYRVHV